MEPAGAGRMAVSLVLLAGMAAVVWRTMEPGRYQQLTWLLLCFFAVRVVLGRLRSRRMENEVSLQNRDRMDM